jgi:hypothetical protein
MRRSVVEADGRTHVHDSVYELELALGRECGAALELGPEDAVALLERQLH